MNVKRDNISVGILEISSNSDAVISAAGRISTTEGDALSIYERSRENGAELNGKLIKKIISSGHTSVLEHVNINLYFNNVSVFAEQFMIEFRLASFTVKSRRYVDFSHMGHYVPAFGEVSAENRAEALELYNSHAEFLFDSYGRLLEKDIPKEDARFVLPYSFRSNFYCTVNLRELLHIIDEMLYGRGSKYDEISDIGRRLYTELVLRIPYIEGFVKNRAEKKLPVIKQTEAAAEVTAADVTLLRGTDSPETAVCMAYALNHGIYGVDAEDTENQRKIIKTVIDSRRRRELEQVNFTILFKGVSLAGITHFVRHRMQSIIIPEYIRACEYKKYIVPESINNAGAEQMYRDIFKKTEKVSNELTALGMTDEERVYLFLSGMTADIMTTMNANELLTFCRLRTCNRAQWEIKRYADELLCILREKHPVLFGYFGPSCYVAGRCPEGHMTCGKMEQVINKYSHV